MSEAVGRHVFICGYPRSGSTMFYNMLRTTVTNFAFLEREMTARAVIARPEDYVTKRPLDIFDIDKILAANVLKKTIYCIILIRDVRSVVTSFHSSVPDDYFIGFDRQYFVRDGTATYTNPGVLQIHGAIARAWQRRDLTKIVVRYEDILKAGDTVQSQLGTAVGFQYRGALHDFYKHETPPALEHQLNTRRPPDRSTIEAWRAPTHRERIKDQFTRCPQLFTLLKTYGYETDDRWFEAYRDGPPQSIIPPRRAYRAEVLKAVPPGGVGAEIGVWKGDFSQVLLDRTQPKMLHLIDPWRFVSSRPHLWYGGAKARDQDAMDAIYAAVCRRFRDDPRVIVHRSSSERLLEVVPSGSLDWTYIDGDHGRDTVLRDLHLCWEAVRPGGLLLGDDFVWRDADGSQPIRLAVADFTAAKRIEASQVINGQFLIRRP